MVLALTRGRHRSIEICRRWATHIPFLDGDKLAVQAHRVADRLGQFLAEPQVLRRAMAWAAAFWLLDAASLFVFIAALGTIVSPIDLLVAYGLAQVLAVIPITPSGLGVVEGVLIPTLTGFGVPQEAALLGVLGYRLVNFWLPIPVGGIAYLSLRFSGEGWRQRLRDARDEVSSLEGDEVRRTPDSLLRSADAAGGSAARRRRGDEQDLAGRSEGVGVTPAPGAIAGQLLEPALRTRCPPRWAPASRCRWDRGPRSWCRRRG